MRILFTLLRNNLLEMQSKILLYSKKASCEKVCRSFGRSWVLGDLGRSWTTLSYSNDKYIYIAKNIILTD